MADWVLTFVRDVALAVWLGGLIVIDFVETPARFRVTGLNRNQVVAVGREVFAAFNRTEASVGAPLVAAGVLLAGRAAAVSPVPLAGVVCVSAMWLVALTQYFWARPRMSAATKGLDLVKRRPTDARLDAFRRWHKTYVALDLVKLALGLVALGLWVWR
jgi:uncharacterized membrane protein